MAQSRVKDQAAEATIAAFASNATKAGAGATIFGWLTLNDLVLVGGLLIAAAGFVVNLYYRRKSDRREGELHAERLRNLREP